MGINLFAGLVGSLRGTFFEWFPTVSLDIIMKVWWLEMHVIEPISTPTEWIHRLKRAKQIYSEQITKIANKIKLSEKIPVGWIKKTLTDARSRRLPRGLTKTLSSCKYGPKKIFLPFFFLNGKRVFSEKYRILSLSGQFTLLGHDFGFMNRENMTIEKI